MSVSRRMRIALMLVPVSCPSHHHLIVQSTRALQAGCASVHVKGCGRVSRHRSRIVALQAIVVGVLAGGRRRHAAASPRTPARLRRRRPPAPSRLVPVAGRLRPAHRRARRPQRCRPRSRQRARQRSRQRSPQRPAGPGPGRDRRRGRDRAAATVPAPAVGAAPVIPGGAVPGAESERRGQGSPTDDQYADTLTRITERLQLSARCTATGSTPELIPVTFRTC